MKRAKPSAIPPTLRRLERAAMIWWRSHRPVAWTLARHIAEPMINAYYSPAATILALRCAAHEKAMKKGKK